ncbi:Hfq-related RNA-binding protein [Prochlorothrix hollandica]|uniref:Hfq-related domain-containing protein n=1 Tax=Prochlorothrix hollandica PCC 9006 = CALU 1027 TaxID=317619 RepID=A0A0M2PQ15_PROHO|nr:RNA chaperone Hfq [Prochlorothrix hollandica]KKI98675.1 hypothetical protein PROH_17645 [Prochlorothrix hollandica PCC 9006 = CALU 1027]
MSAPAKIPDPLDTSLPSTRNLQGFIRDKKTIEVKLTTGDVMKGTILWLDPTCICLNDGSDQTLLVWRQAITYLRTLGT